MTPRPGAWCLPPAGPPVAHWFPSSKNCEGSLLMTTICGKRFHQRVRLERVKGTRPVNCKACLRDLEIAAKADASPPAAPVDATEAARTT